MERFSLLFFILIFASSISYADNINIIYHSPQPNAKNCTPSETIIFSVFEEINQSTIDNSFITVSGSISGPHPGVLFVSTDKTTMVFKPNTPFNYSETVTVTINSGIKTIGGKTINQKSFSFNIRNPRTVVDFTNMNSLETRIPYSKLDYKLFPVNYDNNTNTEPNLNVTNSLNPSYGRIFLSSFRSDGVTYTPYLTIHDNSGALLFSKIIPGTCHDFKKQKNGTYSYFNSKTESFYQLDSNFNLIDSIICGNGYTTDLHELLIYENGNMLIMSYDSVEIDMSQIVNGGNPNALVSGLVIQELDKNKNVIFQWRSWEEMEITDASHQDLTASKVDYAHGNSIDLDWDGNLLISSRHLDEVTKINRKTGKIIWRLGGKKNQFTFINDDIRFSHQHDARRVAPGRITIFDNGNFHSPPFSRVIEYELDEVNLTAKLVWQFDHSKEIYGFAMGNAQRLSNGNTFIGWGFTQPNVTEVTPLGKIIYEMSLDPGYISYRAFKYPYDQPESQYPESYILNQNYPNPFNPSTVITFNIPQQSRVSLKVYDMLGREVSVLANNDFSAGEHYVQFNAENLSSGVYFYNLVSGSFSETKKMVLLK